MTMVYTGGNPITTVVSVGTTSTTLLAANQNRRKLMVSNTSANNVYLDFAGGTITGTNGILLAPGATLIDDTAVTPNKITAIAATAASSVTVTEVS